MICIPTNNFIMILIAAVVIPAVIVCILFTCKRRKFRREGIAEAADGVRGNLLAANRQLRAENKRLNKTVVMQDQVLDGIKGLMELRTRADVVLYEKAM